MREPACWALRKDGRKIDCSRGVFVRQEAAVAAAARLSNRFHFYEAVPLVVLWEMPALSEAGPG